MWQSTVSVRKQMWMQLVTSVTLAHSQSDSVSREVCQRLEWSIVHSSDLVSLQMLVGSFVLDCWRGFVQDNMSPNRKECMRWWRCMRCHVRQNGLVSCVMQEWLGMVSTFIFRTSYLSRSQSRIAQCPFRETRWSVAHTGLFGLFCTRATRSRSKVWQVDWTR